MLTKKTDHPCNTQYYEYDPFEKAKRLKTKLDEAFEDNDESFERKDFYRLLKEGYRLLNRYLKEQGSEYDYAE